MLSFEFPTVVAVIVTFAAVLYIMEQLSVMINRDRGTRLRRIMTKFEKIHDDATKEIDDVSFDLYWSGIVDDVKYQLREHVVIPQEMREMLPLEAIDSLLEPQVQADPPPQPSSRDPRPHQWQRPRVHQWSAEGAPQGTDRGTRGAREGP